MPTGYAPLIPSPDVTYDDVLDEFEWRIPDTYNIGSVALDPPSEEHDRPALLHTDDRGTTHEFTYRELRTATAALQTELRDLGVERGDRVGLCFPQSPELLVAHLATYRLGAVTVPLSMILGGESLSYSLSHADVTGLLVDAEAAERLGDAIENAELEFVLDTELGVEYPDSERHRALGGLRSHVSGDESARTVDTAPDDPATVVYTSGTSGKPKGVVQNHQYLLGTLPGYQLWFELFGDGHGERVWTPAEWAWAGSLFDAVFPTLAMGGVVSSRVRRRGFDPSVALAHIEEHGVSRLFAPATALWQFRERADADRYDLSSLSVVMAGGEKLPAPLLRWTAENLDVRVNEVYGQTEANALVGNSGALFEIKPDSMGRGYPGHDCRIVDEDGEELSPGETGEIALRPPDPVVFAEYLNDPDATAAAFDDDGWYRTGDLATVDEDGYFHFRGRKDDLIITAGYRVSPTEVEIAIREVPWVTQVAVGGAPDPERGQRVKAYVVASDDAPADTSAATEQLRERVRDALGAHKVPREIAFLTDPPETRTGKLDRSKLF